MFRVKLKWTALVFVGLATVGLSAVLATGKPRATDQAAAQQEVAEDRQEADEARPAAAAKNPDDLFDEALQRARVRQQLRTIGQAHMEHGAAFGQLPEPAITDKEGKPLLSWRVSLLPFLDQEALYKQFKLDEPWDSPNNKKLIAKMPSRLRSRGQGGPATRDVLPIHRRTRGDLHQSSRVSADRRWARAGQDGADGPGYGWIGGSVRGRPGGNGQPRQARRRGWGSRHGGGHDGGSSGLGGFAQQRLLRRIPDGPANTILVVEAGSPVVWTKPEDVAYDPKKPVPRLGGQFASIIHVLTADGKVRALPRRLDERTLRAAITPAGGEPINMEKIGSVSVGAAVREGVMKQLQERNTQLKTETSVLRDMLHELKQEMDEMRWAVEAEQLLKFDPAAAALQKENVQLERSLREARDEARQLSIEINRLKQELRKRQKK